MIQVAVIEDEESAFETLEKCLTRYEIEADVKFNVTHFTDAELFLTNYKPKYDIVFMDIKLPGMDGLTAARRLRKFDEDVVLLFTTTMAQFAIKGYEVNALDYFVKPYKYYDMKMRLDRVVKIIDRSEVFVPVPVAGGIKSVRAADVLYIESRGHTITYHTVIETAESRGTLKELSHNLAASGFVMCNSCYLVNLAHCKQVNGNAVKVGNDELIISRGKKQEFLAAFSRYLHGGG